MSELTCLTVYGTRGEIDEGIGRHIGGLGLPMLGRYGKALGRQLKNKIRADKNIICVE